jgi:hypothetical protein
LALVGASKLLGIYLNDHLAGSDAALAVARRSAESNEDNSLGAFLLGLITEIEEDRSVLLAIMGTLGVRRDVVKEIAVRVAERAGRLKLNGRLTSYSPLSRLEELEGLCLGVEGKASLWRALREIQPDLIDLAGFDFDALIVRAEGQRKQLEDLRIRAARQALRSD